MIGFVRRIAALLGSALLLLTGCSGLRPLRVGDQLPPFTVEGWNGGTISPASLAGRPACLDFWASWCPACTPALPALDAIARRHPEVSVIAINIDASRADGERSIAIRLPDRRLTLARDPDGEVFRRFSDGTMPALFVIDADGVVRVAESGYGIERLTEVERLLTDLGTAGARR